MISMATVNIEICVRKKTMKISAEIEINVDTLDQDLSYGEILAGRPEACLVKNIFFYA